MPSPPHPLKETRVAVIGLGYVGLPLAVAFAGRFPTLGFDVDPVRIRELQTHQDRTGEVASTELESSPNLRFSANPSDLAKANFFVVAVPTPTDAAKRPDLSLMEAASRAVGGHVQPGDTVVFESTVYPGATEEVCIPILEQTSGLRYREDFHVGYSPERINPGDRTHRLSDIVKVTSGSSEQAASLVDAVYGAIIRAGTHRAPSIRVAEAAKVIENTQRDLNIALVNELALIFDRLGIDTLDVLEAAGTKWNFLPFRPGLVGGHCISVDPYYLTYKAQSIGYHPEVILAGRRINDEMGTYIANRVLRGMLARRISPVDAHVLVLGLTFKENCPDLRNTRVVDIVRELKACECRVDVHDPWAGEDEARREYGIELVTDPATGSYDAIIAAVGHDAYRGTGVEWIRSLGRDNCVVFDVKGILPRECTTDRL